MKGIIPFILYTLLLFSLDSCHSKKISLRANDTLDYCPPSEAFDFTSKADLVPIDIIIKDSILLKKYTVKDLLLANAIGIYPLLKEMDSLKKANKVGQVEYLEVQQNITIRLLRFSSQVQGVVAEIDCEGERAQQMSSFLEEINTKNVNRLTIASILAGAISGIITSVSKEDKTDKTIGVSGGVISAGLGLMALIANKKIHYHHKRNLLADIWLQGDSSCHYPSSVWNILNEKRFSNLQDYSISHNIRERWINFEYINTKKKEDKLFFGEGGKYTIDQLKTRSNMLDQLQSAVRQIHQNIEILISRVAKD